MAVGETRNVQVRLENSLPLRAGDHVVVLSYSPVMLIGGGRVLLSRCRRSRELAEGERALYAAIESGDTRAVWALGWCCRRCRLRRLMLPRLWILASARSILHCACWWRRALLARLLARMARCMQMLPCSTPR